MSVFYLKRNDTRPTIEVQLLDPDGSVHDLTGSTAWKLHVRLASSVLTRDMTPDVDLTTGILRYVWLATDWSTLAAGTYRMEVEVTGPGDARLTWPNDGYDHLHVTADIGNPLV